MQPPSNTTPPRTEQEFEEMLAEFAHDTAPARFAIFAEVGTRVDGEVIGWGLDFGAEAVVIGDGMLMTCATPERAAALLGRLGPVRLVRVDPVPADPVPVNHVPPD